MYTHICTQVFAHYKSVLDHVEQQLVRNKDVYLHTYMHTFMHTHIHTQVFAHYISVLDHIEQQLVRNKVGHIRIDGSVTSLDRAAAVCCSVLQCVAVCCSVLQRAAVCHSEAYPHGWLRHFT